MFRILSHFASASNLLRGGRGDPGWNKFILCLLLITLTSVPSRGQFKQGTWTEIVGKEVVNNQGVTLGFVRDTAIDLERGRYFGVLVGTGGIFGGGKLQVVPPGVLTLDSNLNIYRLDMDKAAFRRAPNCELSEDRGPPNLAQAAEVYRYFGQPPYFALATSKESKLVQLGYVMEGSRILQLPVQNLQGKPLGRVQTLMYLDAKNGRFKGVVVDDKIVPPEALRYNFDHTVLRLNNHEESFANTAEIKLSGGTFTSMGSIPRPGVPPPPLPQGNSPRDKSITEQIIARISGSMSLSHYAKNIQVGTVQGKTTLQGRVETRKEKDLIQGFALQAAGAGRVENLLMVSPMNVRDKAVDKDM